MGKTKKRPKKKQFHPTGNQLKSPLAKTAGIRRNAAGATFTAVAALYNYVLWKTESMGPSVLARYNERVQTHYLETEDPQALDTLNETLKEKAGFDITTVLNDTSGADTMERKVMEASDHIHIASRRCMLCYYAALMDMGYGKVRLNRVKAAIDRQLDDVEKGIGPGAMDMRRELMEKTGIMIEMPKHPLPDINDTTDQKVKI